jgi:hypothetical protein
MKIFTIHNQGSIRELVSYLSQCDKTMQVKVSSVKAKRTLAQNATYQLWLKQMGNEWGYSGKQDLEYLNEELLRVIVGTRTITVLGHTREAPSKTTSQMSVEEKQEYMENVARFAANQGVFLNAGS